MPRTEEQTRIWKQQMDAAKARKAAQAVAVMDAPDTVQGIPDEALAALRKNVTTKEGIGLAYDMGLELYEARSQQVWPEMRTVLVNNNEVGGNTQVNEYEGYGYCVLEDGKKSQFTVPNRDMTRMGVPKYLWEEKERERMELHNSKHDLARLGRKKEELKGTAYAENAESQTIDSILKAADANAARVQAEMTAPLDEATQAEYDRLVAQGTIPGSS